MKTGVVIGKFYPPHNGHLFLIQEAATEVDMLTVIVCDDPVQEIAGSIRAQWLREVFGKDTVIRVITVPDIGEADNSKIWAEYTLTQLGYEPDYVFTSETYGAAYAHYLNAKHKLIDWQRNNVAISARQIRKAPLKYWRHIPAPVKSYYAKRVCVIGAESTGTTTLAKELAKQFCTNWVPEYGRYYYEGRMYAPDLDLWDESEFVHIARQQQKLEDKLAEKSSGLIICDTNAYATCFWCEYYTGSWSSQVEQIANTHHADLYIITDIDIPFEQDGTREGTERRKSMHERLLAEFEASQLDYLVVSGDVKERIAKTSLTIEKKLLK